MPKSPVAGIQIRLKLSSAAGIGPGKVELLKAVEETGSIAKAAKSMAMSYRRAWLLIDEMNRVFVEPVLDAATGGTRGGGSRLSATGRRIVSLYEDLERKAAQAVRLELDGFAELVVDEPRPSADKNAKEFGKAKSSG